MSTTQLLGQTRVLYQWLRLEQLDQWWHWAVLVGVVVVVLLFSGYWYRRDSEEHRRPVGWALLLLRLAALAGILLYFMQFDRRTEKRIVRDSRVAILVDKSLSMSLPGTPSSARVANPLSRAGEVESLLGQSDFIERLQQEHLVSVYGFGGSGNPELLASVNKASQEPTVDIEVSENASDVEKARIVAWFAVVLVASGLLAYGIALAAQVLGIRDWNGGAWLLFFGSGFMIAGLVTAAFAVVPNTGHSLLTLLGMESAEPRREVARSSVQDGDGADEGSSDLLPEDWTAAVEPLGSETRLGDALRYVLERESGNPLAGVVVLTDGRSNAGLSPKAIVPRVQDARIPIHVVGLGSERSPTNIELVEVDVPRRLYPGDRFALSAIVGSNGFEGRTVSVQILAGRKDADVSAFGIEAEKSTVLGEGGSLTSVDFELEPKSVGEWKYVARIVTVTGDSDPDDDSMSAIVEVIERKNRVLIFAGGPSREYQFVRNLLYRDKDVESNVLLQSGGPLTSQESQTLLQEFPSGRVALSEYDAILAFDADWTQVADADVRAVEQWVAEQAGGLLIVAGSVEMPKWIARSASGVRSELLRSLSPVVLERRGSALLASGRVEAETPWPLEITTDGQQMEFMWLTDNAQSSAQLWSDFSGVHTYYSAYELKPAAKALALFSDPTAAIDGQLPIYLASQFYGAGRVVFQGGSEIWRIRRLGDQYFDRYYTKLVRWISQGRLMLDSDRGTLLVDRDEALMGQQVAVRAVLRNERFEPLVQSEVVARLISPNGSNSPLALRPMSDGSQPGVYTGQFTVLAAGEHRVQLQLGGLASDDILSVDVRGKFPATEMQQPERDDELLQTLATASGGQYWQGVEPILDSRGEAALAVLPAQDQIAFLPGAPDREFQLRWLGWLMVFIGGCLSLEWLARRLHRLA